MKCSKGQSLVEVVVAVGAMSVLLVALLALVALSLRNSRLSKDRAKAVALAGEGVELIRSYRDYNWTGLVGAAGASYNLPANWVVEAGLSQACLAERQIDNFFWRCADIDSSGGQVTVAVSVSWPEGSQTFTTRQNTQLSLWER